MKVLEKIKRCVSLVWDFQEIYGEEDIEDFCSNELHTYPQHDEIMEYFKQIAEIEKENANLKDVIEGYKKIVKWCDKCDKLAVLEKENAELKEEMNAKQVVLNDFKSRVETVTDRFNKKSSQLTKAKEIIRDFLLMAEVEHLKDRYETVDEAEQFLSEV